MKPLQSAALVFCLTVPVVFGGCGGSSSSSGGDGGGGEDNPSPTISSISPTDGPQGGSSFSLKVSGSGFVAGSEVQWEKAGLTTTYVSSTVLTAQVPPSDLASKGTFAISVSSPAPGGGTSAAVKFTVGNPIPAVASIQPSSAMAGSAGLILSVAGSNFLVNSKVEWNGTPLTTTYVSASALTAQVPASDLAGAAMNTAASVTVVNPSPGGGSSSSSSFEVLAQLTYVKTINLPANDVVWDDLHSKLYASLPGADNAGNSVVAIDPASGSVGTPQPAGPEPDELGLSDDSSLLYAGLDGTGQIVRFNLPDLSRDASFKVQLPKDATFGQLNPITLAVAPGKPHTFAVRIGNRASPPNLGGIGVFDDETERPTVIQFPFRRWDVQWGADASVLYGSSDSSDEDFTVMSVDSSGITVKSNTKYMDPTDGNIHYDRNSGLAYLDGGWVIDPIHGNVLGGFDLNVPINARFISPKCAPDPQQGVIFFLGKTPAQDSNNSGVTITAFDANTHRLLGMLPIDGPTGYPGRFLRWGAAGLAFVMAPSDMTLPGGGVIYLVDGNFVNPGQPPDFHEGTVTHSPPAIGAISPQSAVAGSAEITLTVTGTRFLPSSQITWHGSHAPSNALLETTFVSSTELRAQVPANDLANADNVTVSVADTTTGLESVIPLVFTVLPPNETTIILPINLASRNVAWDSKNQHLVSTVSSRDTNFPNSVVVIDPVTGAVLHAAAVLADPSPISVTDDGSYAYMGYTDADYRGANFLTRLSLPNLDSPITFALPSDSALGPLWAWDIQAEHGTPHTIAVDFSSSNGYGIGNVTLYDDDLARPEIGQAWGYLEWGAGNTQLYTGLGPRGSSNWRIATFNVDTTGVTLAQDQVVSGSSPLWGGSRVHFDSTTGYLHEDSGTVINPVTGDSVGSYVAPGAVVGFVALDPAMNRTFVLGATGPLARSGTGTYVIQSFDKTSFAPIDAITLPILVGTPAAFIRWGSHGLAIVTDDPHWEVDGSSGPPGMLYIISDSKFVRTDVE